ncbi:hypothetical protein LX36DRAFT_754252, partial [Colletotrichum falcatum]
WNDVKRPWRSSGPRPRKSPCNKSATLGASGLPSRGIHVFARQNFPSGFCQPKLRVVWDGATCHKPSSS